MVQTPVLIACRKISSVRSWRVAAMTNDVATRTGKSHKRYWTEIPIFDPDVQNRGSKAYSGVLTMALVSRRVSVKSTRIPSAQSPSRS